MADFLYAHRPSKHVQRRMIVDACRRLDRIAPLEAYRFVGFGAYEYVDFELVRRELGIVGMDSIEADVKHQARYEFNRPFHGIELHFARASDVLPDLLDAAVRRIVWLDYLEGVDREVLTDLGTCVRKLAPGSVMLITVRARPEGVFDERRDRLVAAVGSDRVPDDVDNARLGKGTGDVQRGILASAVPQSLRRRDDDATFTQLFDIRYKDGVPMQTWGGLLSVPEQAEAVAAADFGALEQVSLASEPAVGATVPPLTTREVLYLNQRLPCGEGGRLTGEDIPEEQLDAYERLYRWYPPVPAAM